MQQTIRYTMYKDLEAVTLENDHLIAQFLPDYGGKMVSFFHKKTGREFLVQAPESTYKKLVYDGDYVAAECSGFDDMFPTIDKVHYEDYPWKGVEIPDHGEVCGLKWDYEIRPDCLYMSVYGVRFPYRLEKWISFQADGTLNIAYKATNLSSYDMDFLWAAHPMINTEAGGEILLPYEGQQQAMLMFSTEKRLGSYGDIISWPEAISQAGTVVAINQVENNPQQLFTSKYYFKQPMPQGWCAYRYNSDGTTLKLSFPEKEVPYLGIWVNEGGFKSYRNIALEMCTGSLDRPDLAKKFGQNSILPAKGDYSWYLNFQVD